MAGCDRGLWILLTARCPPTTIGGNRKQWTCGLPIPHRLRSPRGWQGGRGTTAGLCPAMRKNGWASQPWHPAHTGETPAPPRPLATLPPYDPVAQIGPELSQGKQQPGPAGDDQFRLPAPARPQNRAGQPLGWNRLHVHPGPGGSRRSGTSFNPANGYSRASLRWIGPGQTSSTCSPRGPSSRRNCCE